MRSAAHVPRGGIRTYVAAVLARQAGDLGTAAAVVVAGDRERRAGGGAGGSSPRLAPFLGERCTANHAGSETRMSKKQCSSEMLTVIKER